MIPRHGKSLHAGDADAHPRERTRPGGDRHAGHIVKRFIRELQNRFHHRHQRLAVRLLCVDIKFREYFSVLQKQRPRPAPQRNRVLKSAYLSLSRDFFRAKAVLSIRNLSQVYALNGNDALRLRLALFHVDINRVFRQSAVNVFAPLDDEHVVRIEVIEKARGVEIVPTGNAVSCQSAAPSAAHRIRSQAQTSDWRPRPRRQAPAQVRA